MQWGVSQQTEVEVPWANKPERHNIVSPESLGTRREASDYALEHGGNLTRVMVVK